jgi:hypothetical protein
MATKKVAISIPIGSVDTIVLPRPGLTKRCELTLTSPHGPVVEAEESLIRNLIFEVKRTNVFPREPIGTAGLAERSLPV